MNLNKQTMPGRVLECGCVVCVCLDAVQCQGCGAKNCGSHGVGVGPKVEPEIKPQFQSPVERLARRLAYMLDDDQWNNIEPHLKEIAQITDSIDIKDLVINQVMKDITAYMRDRNVNNLLFAIGAQYTMARKALFNPIAGAKKPIAKLRLNPDKTYSLHLLALGPTPDADKRYIALHDELGAGEFMLQLATEVGHA